jgi:hypothetical protein
MFTFHKLALGNFRQRVNSALQNIFLLKITVIVDEDLKEMLGILRELVENVEDQVLVVVD